MVYSTFLKRLFHAAYGSKIPRSPVEGDGLVMVADGVGGLDLCGTVLTHEAAAAGLPLEIRVIHWGHGFGRWHADLTDSANRDDQAAAIADEVLAFRAGHPEAPVFLVGKSGGTGVVAKALEGLPEGSVERAILLAPALSPTYDLSKALAAVKREIVVFWSPLDVIVLGAGTRIFGTIDRVRTASAGLVGFRSPGPPGSKMPEAYGRLRQVRWHPKMAPTMYLGGHIGPDSPWFIRKYVIPLLAVRDVDLKESATVSSRPRSAPIT